MILDPQEMLKAERHLIEGGINPESLMDEAGLGIANAVSQFFPEPGNLIVFVGHGHNGGDALVAARFLKIRGWIVQLKLVTSIDRLKPLTRKKLQQFEKEKNSTYSSSDSGKKLPIVSIDGLLGIGASGELRSEYLEAAKEINLAIPLVVRLAGTNAAQGKEILKKSNLKIISANNLSDAAKKIIEVTK